MEQTKQNNKNIINSIKDLFRKDHGRKDLGIIDFLTIEMLPNHRKLVDLNDFFTEPIKVSVAESDGQYSITRNIHLPVFRDETCAIYVGSQGWKTVTEEKNYKSGDYLFIGKDAKVMGHVEKEKIGQEWLLIDNKIEIKYISNSMGEQVNKVLTPGLYISRLYNYPERQHQIVGIKMNEDFKFTRKKGDTITGNTGDWLVSSKKLYDEYTFVVNSENFATRYVLAEELADRGRQYYSITRGQHL